MVEMNDSKITITTSFILIDVLFVEDLTKFTSFSYADKYYIRLGPCVILNYISCTYHFPLDLS